MCAGTGLTDFDNGAPVGVDDAFDDAQSQTEATGAGREKWGEDARLDVGGNAGTAVQEVNFEVAAATREIG